MQVAMFFISAIVGYLVGSISWSIMIGKIFFKKDVRDFQSGNAGATNTGRVLGNKIGLLVLALDVLKPFLAGLIIRLIQIGYGGESYATLYACLFTVVGHCWPVFFKFRGGKAASCLGGSMLLLNPLAALAVLAVFILIMIVIGYVSLSSIISAALCPFMLFIFNQSDIDINWWLTSETLLWAHTMVYVITSICAVIVIYKHKDNFKRIVNSEERLSGIHRKIFSRK